ncbi:pilus assembly protein TadG-related protein [Streptomyces sp. NPDC005423]|uniref:pilus assembly protein TadG-related protein n=1 Tax=Streptomyces sp. NPDC005423 TaxID=3155343 RepID=UPI0033B2CAE4
MSGPRRYSDSGQVFPIYITVVGGLLFLALAYFAVGQATVNRSGAQTAADAAALAAAQDLRDELAGQWVTDLLDPTKWGPIFAGAGTAPGACARAGQLAGQNDAVLKGCLPTSHGVGYDIVVQTRETMGRSVVPITAHKRSKASATAVVQPLCHFQLPGTGTGTGGVLPELFCDNQKTWNPDPQNPTSLPGPADLFDVHLAD